MEIVARPRLQSPFCDGQCSMSRRTAVKVTSSVFHLRNSAAFRVFATSIFASTAAVVPEIVKIPEPSAPGLVSSGRRRGGATSKKVGFDSQQMKLNWLESLSGPSPESWRNRVVEGSEFVNESSDWVIGIDPDLSGAMAVLKPDNSSEVFDSPCLKVLVGKRVRKRLDVKSIVMLLRSVDAPAGTSVYLEQSIPFPQDGKQGWWSGGFGYGLWIGILVASGYSVVPVPSGVWKNEFKLTGNRSSKDDSRELASTLFPSLKPLFKRKKDHGRAEAVLIAAYGKGIKVNEEKSLILENLIS